MLLHGSEIIDEHVLNLDLGVCMFNVITWTMGVDWDMFRGWLSFHSGFRHVFSNFYFFFDDTFNSDFCGFLFFKFYLHLVYRVLSSSIPVIKNRSKPVTVPYQL